MMDHDIHNCLKLSSLHPKESLNGIQNLAHMAPKHNRNLSSVNLNENLQHNKSQSCGNQQVGVTYAPMHTLHSRNHVRIAGNGKIPVMVLNNNISQTVHMRTGTQNTMLQGPKHTQKQVVCESTKVSDAAEELHKITEVFELNFSDQEGPSKEGGSVDVAEIVAIQKGVDPSTLTLLNSFDLLQEDSELPSGEVKLADKDPNHISNVTLLESAEIVEKVSKEIVSLDQDAHSKVSVIVENDIYEPVIVNTKDTTLSKQHSKTGRKFLQY